MCKFSEGGSQPTVAGTEAQRSPESPGQREGAGLAGGPAARLGGRQAEVGEVGSQRLASPREPLSRPGSDQWAVIIPRRARSRRGGSRGGQERGGGRGSAGRRGTHVTLIDSPGGRRAGASGARSLSENPCSHLLSRSRPGKLSHGDQQPSPFAYTWAHPFPSDLMGETEPCWGTPGSGESLSSSLGVWSDLTSLPQFTHL